MANNAESGLATSPILSCPRLAPSVLHGAHHTHKMDAGILINAWPEEASFYVPFGPGPCKPYVPTLTAESPVVRSASVALVISTFLNARLKANSLTHVLSGIGGSRSIKEIVLVEGDGQPESLRHLVAKNGKQRSRVLRGAANNRGRSRNIGAEACTSEFLLFLDDDMLLRRWKTVDSVLSAVLEGKYDCALFPRRNYVRFPLLYDSSRLEATLASWRRRGRTSGDPDILDPSAHRCLHKTVRFCFPGCFMLIRAEAYKHVGGFEENYEGWGLEDADFALRVVRQLRILNLFSRTEPLLHLDHSVSPYKSDEHRRNYERFSASFTAFHLDQLCERVFTGKDFGNADNVETEPKGEQYCAGISLLKRAYGAPLDTDLLWRSYADIVQQRLEHGHSPDPEFVVLHGSRARGTSKPESDFDVLCLFKGGLVREFCVQQSEGVTIDLEFTDMEKFSAISAEPWRYPLSGPLELAKISQGVLLAGDRGGWDVSSLAVLGEAAVKGRLYWLVTLIGFRLAEEKHGPVVDRCVRALAHVLSVVDVNLYNAEIDCLQDFRIENVSGTIVSLLHTAAPDWQETVRSGGKVFRLQAPETWKGLLWLSSTS